MLSEGSRRLAGDHVALGELLQQLHAALNNGEVDVAYAKLDLFWAKLAVHIRAEHLHLFPSVLNGLAQITAQPQSGPTLEEARSAIERLRADHDFFMRELAGAVETLRTLVNVSEHSIIDRQLITVKNAIRGVEQRLAEHNDVEENQVYQWVTTALNTEEQSELKTRINNELEKAPQRFAANMW